MRCQPPRPQAVVDSLVASQYDGTRGAKRAPVPSRRLARRMTEMPSTDNREDQAMLAIVLDVPRLEPSRSSVIPDWTNRREV